jgi:glycosyltransferase involved in cell wall biosynthesis
MGRLSRFFRRHDVDLVHAHQYTPFFYAVASRLIGKRPPVLFTEHGRHHPDLRKRKRVIFNRLCLRRADRVVGVGNAVRDALVRNEGIPANRVEVIYNGVDLDRFASVHTQRAEVRRELGLLESDVVVVQTARLHALKDHVTALRAMAKACSRAGCLRLILVGDGPERESIEDQIGSLGLRQSVVMLGTRGDVDRILSAADMAMLSSVSEGIPVTLIEAMAAGLPVVATNVGGVGEVVDTGRTGLLVAARDDVALADALVQLAKDPELRRKMGANGTERVRQLFSGQTMQDSYHDLYDQMIHG